MDKLFPFRGYRYDLAKISRLTDVVTQPYDKISPEMLERYLKLSPCNVARVIKNPDYGQAGQIFHQWLQTGVLKQDPEPCFYPYEQRFEFEGQSFSRLGFIALIPLNHPGLDVKGHESIHQAPLEDRLNLIRRTESNDGLIFSLFSDPSMRVDDLLQEAAQARLPVAETEDEFGAAHRLWKLSDSKVQKRIAECFEGLSLYIADGHHRFQTALRYAEECRAKGWKPAATESFDKRMMALFNMEGPGLRILPTHRGIRDLASFDLERLLRELSSAFETTPHATIEALVASMQGEGVRIGLVAGDPIQCHLLKKRDQTPSAFMRGVQGVSRQLDVNVLHDGILRPILGIGPEELLRQTNVDYYRDRGEMISKLRSGKCQAAFLLNPTRLDQVRAISEEGRKMPQKSTDFYPKLLTGLVFMKMHIEKG